MIGDELDQVPRGRAAGAGGGEQPGRAVRALRAGGGRRRLGDRRGCRRAAHRGGGGAAAQRHHPQHLAGRALRPVDQPVPGLRARLRLLLRAPDAMPISGCRPGSTSRHVWWRGRTRRRCWRRSCRGRATAPEPIAIGTNTDPYQPIEKRFGIMRGILEVLRDFRHPVTDRDQGRADRAGRGHPRRDGPRAGWRGRGSRSRRSTGSSRADGAARGGAGAAARGDPDACRGRDPGPGDDGAGHPGAQRPRDRAAARGGARRRGGGGRLRGAPAAAGGGTALPRLAGGALAGAGRQGDEPGARDARRPRLRPGLGQADEGRGGARPS